MTIKDPAAQLAELERRRAALHRRSAGLRAPGRGATDADEAAFAAKVERIDAEVDDVEREIAFLLAATAAALAKMWARGGADGSGAASRRWPPAGRKTALAAVDKRNDTGEGLGAAERAGSVRSPVPL